MIAIGADHGGFELKDAIIKYFDGKVIFKDFGTNSQESVDYPEYAFKVADSVASGECEAGILICKTGIGMSIAANKVKGIRCALCFNEEVAHLCKEHNNANVIALPASMMSKDEAVKIIEIWLNSKFLGGRHEKRVNGNKYDYSIYFIRCDGGDFYASNDKTC